MSFGRSDGAQILCGGLAGTLIGDDVEGYRLAFVQRAHAGAFDRADMDEHVSAAGFRLNEAETFLAVEPLHCSLGHGTFLYLRCTFGPRRANIAAWFPVGRFWISV